MDCKNCFLAKECNWCCLNEDFCQRKFKLENLYKKSLLADSQRTRQTLKVDSDGTDIEAFTQLSNIEKNINSFVRSGLNLYLWSKNSGNGKTSWSIRLMQAYLNENWPTCTLTCQALMVDVPTFLSRIKANLSAPDEYANYVLSVIKTAPLVVWDDIGTKLGTSFEINTLLEILNYRMNNNKANIFTTNLNQTELKATLDTRLASRIYESSTVIELKGSDKRFLRKEIIE
jgi:DNA replication protein DnaC